MRGLLNITRRFVADRTANVAIIAALSLPAIVGFCGLGTETAYWYFRERDNQGAADVAAYNGAIALRAGSSYDTIKNGATTDAVTNGWKSASGSITVRTPPTTGTHMNSTSVEVILTETQTRYFTGMFTSTPMVITNRAVASYVDIGYACLLALDKSASGAMQFWGSDVATLKNCNAYSDSISTTGFQVGGSAKAEMPCAISAGGFSLTTGLTLTTCPTPISNAGQVADPYVNLPAPPIPANCATNVNASTLSPGKYCGGLSIGGGGTTLNPGVYVISGGNLQINSTASLSGSGVTFYLTNGATVQMNGNSTSTLSAPTSGTYSGVLFYGDRTASMAQNKINGTADSLMTGAIYFPSQEVDMLGNFSGVNGCMQIIADIVHFTGNSTFSVDCTGYGISKIKTAGWAQLVE